MGLEKNTINFMIFKQFIEYTTIYLVKHFWRKTYNSFYGFACSFFQSNISLFVLEKKYIKAQFRAFQSFE